MEVPVEEGRDSVVQFLLVEWVASNHLLLGLDRTQYWEQLKEFDSSTKENNLQVLVACRADFAGRIAVGGEKVQDPTLKLSLRLRSTFSKKKMRKQSLLTLLGSIDVILSMG